MRVQPSSKILKKSKTVVFKELQKQINILSSELDELELKQALLRQRDDILASACTAAGLQVYFLKGLQHQPAYLSTRIAALNDPGLVASLPSNSFSKEQATLIHTWLRFRTPGCTAEIISQLVHVEDIATDGVNASIMQGGPLNLLIFSLLCQCCDPASLTKKVEQVVPTLHTYASILKTLEAANYSGAPAHKVVEGLLNTFVIAAGSECSLPNSYYQLFKEIPAEHLDGVTKALCLSQEQMTQLVEAQQLFNHLEQDCLKEQAKVCNMIHRLLDHSGVAAAAGGPHGLAGFRVDTAAVAAAVAAATCPPPGPAEPVTAARARESSGSSNSRTYCISCS